MAEQAEASGKFNILFEASFIVGNAESYLNVLIKAKRMGEAAFFAMHIFQADLSKSQSNGRLVERAGFAIIT